MDRSNPPRTLRKSRDDPLTSKVRKHPKKHLLGVHQVVESETAGLARIGDDIVIRCEYAVRVAPRRNFLEPVFLQSVAFDDLFPDRALVGHGPRKVDMSRRRQLHPEELGEFGPQVLPPDQITIGDVESLVGAFRIRRHPLDGLCQKSGVRALIERGIRAWLARKAERQPQRLADVGIDSDRQSQVHRSSRGETADRVRTPDRPRPALSLLEFFEKVLRVVIEIWRQVPRIIFPGRGLVVDNGMGKPAGVFAHPKSGLGTGIVKALAKQLDSQVVTSSGPKGTTVSVTHATFAGPEEGLEVVNCY